MASINLSFSTHFNFLADSLFTQASESPEYNVQIHCSDGRVVRANSHLLCLGFHLFREIFGSDCSCVTYLPVVYDVVCSEFSSGVLWKVLKSFITGQVGTDSFEESEIDEVQSILETFKIALPFQIEPLNNSGSRQEEEHVDEIIEGLQAFQSGSSVSRNERQPLDVSITIKVEDDIVCNDTEDGELNNSGPRIDEAPTEENLDAIQNQVFGSRSMETEKNISAGDNQLESHKCHICQMYFHQESVLKRHIDTGHGNEKTFQCQICQKYFSQNHSLKRHIHTVHGNEKPFRCQICPKYFCQKSDLNVHVRTVHRNEKPFQCQICQKYFGHKCHLNVHFRTVHGNEKPFQCQTCQRNFGYKNDLKRHIRSRHDIKKTS